MAEIRYNQPDFTAGELSPKVFARDDYTGYYKGAKSLENLVVIPQGGVMRRFGTEYLAELSATNPDYVQMNTLTYNDSAEYVLVWEAASVKIYLEGTLNATVVTPYAAEDIAEISFCQAANKIIVSNQNFNPRELARTANAANNVTGYSGVTDTLTITNTLTIGTIYPAKFTAAAMPTTAPQIYADRTYFIKPVTTTTVQIFSTSEDAYNDTNAYTISSAGTTAILYTQNTWAITSISFVNVPAYDFNGNYGAISFTPGATTGNAIVLTASAAIFSSDFVGGYFRGNGGAARIVGYTDTTNVTINIEEDFLDVDPINGDDAYLAEPAWSATKGYPRVCAVFEQRLVFAGSRTLNNGVWLSYINRFYNFNDAGTQDDNAISWYPASGAASYIQSVTSGRTLLVHTNSGTYSTPVGNDLPLTPSNFTLVEQNKDGVSGVTPVFIDNQVIYIDRALANAKNLIFDIIRGFYVLNNISVASSSLLNNPVDMDSFSDPQQTDGSYVLIVNSDGTLAVFQTLYEQNIAAWSPAVTQMSDNDAYFRHVACSSNRAWFIVERIVDGNTKLYLEKLSFDTYMDCTINATVSGTTLSGLGQLEGQEVYASGDGYLYGPETVASGQITIADEVDAATVGLNFTSTLGLLPVGSLQGLPTNLYKRMHIRTLYVQYYQTIGGSVEGAQIQTIDMGDIALDSLPDPSDGVFQISMMGAWDLMSYDINIVQSLPLPFTILGVGYTIEVP